MCVFLGVALPMALYWPLRNYIRFGMPMTYIPPAIDMYDGISHRADQPLLQRLSDFRLWQFTDPYPCSMPMGSAYNEFNPLIGLIKTGSTGYTSPGYSDVFFGHMILWSNLIMMIAAFLCMVFVLCKKQTMPLLWKVSFLSFYAVMIISYYIFCIRYPYPCTEHIRYVSPTVVTGALFVGKMLSWSGESKKHFSVVLKRLLIIVVCLFCAASTIFFTHMGYYTSFFYHFMSQNV